MNGRWRLPAPQHTGRGVRVPDIVNPDQVIDAIRTASDRIAKGVRVCDQRLREFLDADRAADQAFARAYLAHDGPAHEKRYAAELATVGERTARDAAHAAYKYAERQAAALDAELRAWQSVGKSVATLYQTAGLVER